MPEIEQNLVAIRARIDEAFAKHNRAPSEVQILAATKTQPVEKIQRAISAGIKVCGENYLQEAEKKILEIGNAVEWHFIGHLQSNKAKKAVELFDCIQGVDSLKLAQKISNAVQKPFPIFIEVNIGEEKSKFGVLPQNFATLYTEIMQIPNIEVRGLMCMAPFVSKVETRPFFQKMKQLATEQSIKELSMGMSNDFEVAVEEGATMPRLGTAIFGKREK